jgi:hypothetical protein
MPLLLPSATITPIFGTVRHVLDHKQHIGWRVGEGGTLPESEQRARIDAALERIVGLGGSVLRTMEERGQHGVVMHDP